MLKINFAPQRREDVLTIETKGDTLIVNNERLDFSQLVEDATLPYEAINNKWIASNVTKKNGVIELTLILPNKKDASEAARFPVSLLIETDGKVVLPE